MPDEKEHHLKLMMEHKVPFDTTSSVAWVNKGRVPGLGRGPGSKNALQSPTSSVSDKPSGESDTTLTGVHGQPSGAAYASSTASKKQVSEVNKSGSVVTQGTGPSSSGATGSGQRHTETGLSGAEGLTKNQRRKLRRKLGRKVTPVSAGGSGTGLKRLRSDESTPSPNVHKLQKKPREEVQPRKEAQSGREVQLREDDQPREGNLTGKDPKQGSYAQAIGTTKLAIVKKDFPSDRLTAEGSDDILREILGLTDSIPIGERMPEIHGHNLLNGALVIQCGNDTVEWIRGNFESKVLGDMVLRVLRADELPKPVKVAFRTKERFSDQSTLLRRLQRLNPELKSTGWRVLQSVAGPDAPRWIFEVDPDDADAIRRANFRAFTGVDRGTFKIIHDPNRKKPSGEEPKVPVAPSDQKETSGALPSMELSDPGVPPALMETSGDLPASESPDPEVQEVEEECTSSASSQVSTHGTTEAISLNDLDLGSESECTLQSDSPRSVIEMDEALLLVGEDSPPGPSLNG